MLPILVFAGSLICLGNLLGLALFILAYRRQSARQHELLQKTRGDFQDALNQILNRYQELRTQAEDEGEWEQEDAPEYETIATTLPALQPLGTGLNFSKRTQILRLHRQGASAGEISVELGVQKAEVELIVKLHRGAEETPTSHSSRAFNGRP